MVFFTCLLVANHFAEVSAASYDLTPAADVLVRVKTAVGVEGSLCVHSAKTTPAPLPLNVQGDLVFDPRAMSGSGCPRLRYYWHMTKE